MIYDYPLKGIRWDISPARPKRSAGRVPAQRPIYGPEWAKDGDLMMFDPSINNEYEYAAK